MKSKQEDRLIKTSDGRELLLPMGLTYDIGSVQLCVECGGVVQDNEPMIRRSSYRNRAFEKDFHARNGICLKCTQVLMTNVVARWYEKAEAAVKTYNDLDQNGVKDELTELKLDTYETSIEHMQIFIEKLGMFVGGVDNHKMEYAHEPEVRVDLPKDDQPGEDADQV